MTKDEALAFDLALEALESLFNWKVDPERGQRCSEAVAAIKKVRSAPTSADYAMGYAEGFNDGCKPAPVQEPVALTVALKKMYQRIGHLKATSNDGQHMNIPSGLSAGFCWELAIELEQFITTTPPSAQRQWVGLTDDDFKQMMSDIYHIEIGDGDYYDDILLFRAVEAKLKELNT